MLAAYYLMTPIQLIAPDLKIGGLLRIKLKACGAPIAFSDESLAKQFVASGTLAVGAEVISSTVAVSQKLFQDSDKLVLLFSSDRSIRAFLADRDTFAYESHLVLRDPSSD